MLPNGESSVLGHVTVSADNRGGRLHTCVYCANSRRGTGSLGMHNRFQANKPSADHEYSVIYNQAGTLVDVGGAITPNLTR